MPDPYRIRPAAQCDVPLLNRWRGADHVSRWWGPAIEAEDKKLADPLVSSWIAEHAGVPFAFIQDYAVADWPPHHFDYLPIGSRGMDLYIGEAGMLGHGHGAAVVRQHADHLLAHGAPAVGIDPHPDNHVAIRAFEKAGFQVTSGPVDTRWGVAILMDRYA